MRTNVTLRHSAEFVSLVDEEGILAVSGAQWFALLLRRVPDLVVNEELCQEDWGVVIFVRRGRNKFWIGLSAWEDKGTWLAHFHHGSFAWLQWFSSSGRSELKRLLFDVHGVLESETAITDIAWYEESEMSKPRPGRFPTPG